MDKHIKDDFKKEIKPKIIVVIISFSIALICLRLIIKSLLDDIDLLEDKTGISLIAAFVLFAIIGFFGLFQCIRSSKYKLEITEQKILIQTRRARNIVYFNEIKNYSIQRYKKTQLYTFYLFTAKGVLTLYTRYKDEFISILNSNNIKPTH